MLSEAVYTLRQYTLAHPYSEFSNPSAESDYCPAILHMGTDLHIFLLIPHHRSRVLQQYQQEAFCLDEVFLSSRSWMDRYPELQPLKKESDYHHL